MTDLNADLAAKITQIKHEYLQRLKDEWLNELLAFRAIPAADWNGKILEKLLFHAHSVSGSGATFGYVLLSDHARELEELTRDLAKQSGKASEQDHAVIMSLIDRLSATCHEALKDIPSF